MERARTFTLLQRANCFATISAGGAVASCLIVFKLNEREYKCDEPFHKVPGFSIGGSTNPGDNEIGYIVLMKKNAGQEVNEALITWYWQRHTIQVDSLLLV